MSRSSSRIVRVEVLSATSGETLELVRQVRVEGALFAEDRAALVPKGPGTVEFVESCASIDDLRYVPRVVSQGAICEARAAGIHLRVTMWRTGM